MDDVGLPALSGSLKAGCVGGRHSTGEAGGAAAGAAGRGRPGGGSGRRALVDRPPVREHHSPGRSAGRVRRLTYLLPPPTAQPRTRASTRAATPL